MWAHSSGLKKGSTFTFTINAGIVSTKSVEAIERISGREEKPGPLPDENEGKGPTKKRSRTVSSGNSDSDSDDSIVENKKRKEYFVNALYVKTALSILQEKAGDEHVQSTASINSRFAIDDLVGDISILSGKTVLFCEECDLVRKVITEEMEIWGMQVTSTSEERQALDKSLQVSVSCELLEEEHSGLSVFAVERPALTMMMIRKKSDNFF